MKKYESLKKVDLHCHLDGSLNVERVSKWTRKELDEVKDLLTINKTGDLNDYLRRFEFPISLLQTKTRLRDASKELCSDMIKDNVVYAEIRLDPLAHTKKGLALREVIDAVLEGIQLTDLKAKLILCMKREREFELNKLVVDTAKKYLKKGVAAIDLAGSEKDYPTKNFKELFAYANSIGVPFVVHAGEAGTFKDIDVAINAGAKRIGHGVKAITDYETMEKLKKLDIPLEVCLTSNLNTGLYPNYPSHPVQRLIDSGVPVTICTDNRTLSDTTLTDEYNVLNRYFGFTIKDFNEMNKLAIAHAFLNDKEKTELLKNFL